MDRYDDCSYEQYFFCSRQLSCRPSRDLQLFGLLNVYDNELQLSYIDSIDQGCPCVDSIPEECRGSAWIFRMNGKEMRNA